MTTALNSVFSMTVAALCCLSLPAHADLAPLKVGTEVHWAPDEVTGQVYLDIVVATGPDFVITANPDPTGEWETQYGVEFSGLDAVVCSYPIHSDEARRQLAAMWPLRIGATFKRGDYSITVDRRARVTVDGVEEDAYVLNLKSKYEDHDIYVSDRLKTHLKVDWSAFGDVPDSVPITDIVDKFIHTDVETVTFDGGYEVLAGLDHDKLGNCAALLPGG